MYRKIMVPLDSSDLSESILPYARWFAKAFKPQVELLHVIDPEAISRLVEPSAGRYADVVQMDEKRAVLEYLESVAGSFPDPMAVSCHAGVGKAAEMIVKRAIAQSATLITMATHGRTGIQRWLLGSVANKVLHEATTPLLLVRPSEKSESTGVAALKTIIIPLDGSSLAEEMLPHVAVLAEKMNLRILLLQTFGLPESVQYSADGQVPNWKQILEQMREGAESYLKEIAERFQREGLTRVSTMALQGEAAEHIIEIARRSPDNLVAMCTHGRSGVARLVLGSVTEKVVRYSGEPVLVIRASGEARP